MRLAAAGFAAALPAALCFAGFTVDDALISARVASLLSRGEGYRFNPGGPEVDAVTPLGWAPLLALFGEGDPLAMLERARLIGGASWLLAAALLAGRFAGLSRRSQLSALFVLALSSPAAAWSSSGMETGFVTLLATAALFPGLAGALFAGMAAALRPELVPWAVVLAAGGALAVAAAPRDRALKVALALGAALLPAVLVALVRSAWFGSPAPLALSAKPPDLVPGLRYAVAAALFGGAPLFVVAPFAFMKCPAGTKRLVLAVAAHLAAMALAGGDWMPLFRLLVPVIPTAILAGAELTEHARPAAHAARLGLTAAVSILVGAVEAWPARQVLTTRLEFIARLRPELAGAGRVATVDVGMVGAATSAPLLDLAGVTDPSVAALAGGHTSKRVPDGLIESRGVDRLVLLLAPGERPEDPWRASRFARVADRHVAMLPSVEDFELRSEVPLGEAYRYLVLEQPRENPP